MQCISDIVQEITRSSPQGGRVENASATFGNSATLMENFYHAARLAAAKMEHIPGLVFSPSFQPVSTGMTNKAAQTGGNSFGVMEADGHMFNFLLSAQWDDPADDEVVMSALRQCLDSAIASARAAGLHREYVYLNYAADWQDPIRSYCEAKLEMLRRVSRKCDPGRVFQRQVPGGFNLFEKKATGQAAQSAKTEL